MTREEIREIVDEVIEKCDARYVKKEDCDSDMKVVEDRLHAGDKKFVGLEFQQKLNNWLTAAIAAGIIALVIKVYLGG